MVYDKIEEIFAASCEKYSIKEHEIVSPAYTNGVITFSVSCDATDAMAQELPATFMTDLIEESDGLFLAAEYTGYTASEPGIDDPTSNGTVVFNTTVQMKGCESPYHPDETTDEETSADAE